MAYKNGDFVKYFCRKMNRHIWVLGYFGGGSINFTKFEEAAKDFSKETGIPLNKIHIDEISRSRRFKRFKYLQAPYADNQKPLSDSKVMEDVFDWLKD